MWDEKTVCLSVTAGNRNCSSAPAHSQANAVEYGTWILAHPVNRQFQETINKPDGLKLNITKELPELGSRAWKSRLWLIRAQKEKKNRKDKNKPQSGKYKHTYLTSFFNFKDKRPDFDGCPGTFRDTQIRVTSPLGFWEGEGFKGKYT